MNAGLVSRRGLIGGILCRKFLNRQWCARARFNAPDQTAQIAGHVSTTPTITEITGTIHTFDQYGRLIKMGDGVFPVTIACVHDQVPIVQS